MAVLGLVVEAADTAAGIAFRLQEQFPLAQFPDNAAHNNLPSLAKQGLVELVEKGKRSSLDCYRATGEGRTLLQTWVRESDAAPLAWRDALRGKLAFAERESLIAVLEEISEKEALCTREYGVAHRRVVKKRDWTRRIAGERPDWRAGLRDLLEADEATLWALQARRLQRLRENIEELLQEFGPESAREIGGG